MNESWLEGFISIEAALASPYRTVEAVYVRAAQSKRQQWRIDRLRQLASEHGVLVERAADAFFEANAAGNTHGGLLARVGERRFVELDALLNGGKRPFIVMLDGVEDPFNFGQAVRSLYAAGASGLVLRPRNWTSAASVVGRASAGASERMPMAIAESAEEAASFFQARGLAIACTAEKGALDLYQTDLTQPLFLLIGGEKRGITRSFLRRAELKIRIPYQRPFTYALGVTASTAVIAFERQRQLNRRPR